CSVPRRPPSSDRRFRVACSEKPRERASQDETPWTTRGMQRAPHRVTLHEQRSGTCSDPVTTAATCTQLRCKPPAWVCPIYRHLTPLPQWTLQPANRPRRVTTASPRWQNRLDEPCPNR